MFCNDQEFGHYSEEIVIIMPKILIHLNYENVGKKLDIFPTEAGKTNSFQ